MSDGKDIPKADGGKKPRSPFKKFALGVLAILLVARLGIWVSDYIYYHSGGFKREVTISLVVDGVPIEIKKITKCIPYAFPWPRDLTAIIRGMKDQKGFYADVRRVSHTLESGVHVMMKLPFACREKMKRRNRKITTEGITGIGLPVFLAETYDSRDELLVFDHPLILSHPDSRVRDLRYTIRDVPDDTPADGDDPRAWFMSLRRDYVPALKHIPEEADSALGYYVFPEEAYEDGIRLLKEAGEDIPLTAFSKFSNMNDDWFKAVCPDFKKSRKYMSTHMFTKCRGQELVPYPVVIKDGQFVISRNAGPGLRIYPGLDLNRHEYRVYGEFTYQKKSLLREPHVLVSPKEKKIIKIVNTAFYRAPFDAPSKSQTEKD